jgi:hypothetical protein
MVEERETTSGAQGRAPSLLIDHALFVECVRRASAELEPLQKVETLLPYLESFPLGAHNRDVAERLEVLFDRVGDEPGGRGLFERFRDIRDRYLPPILRF